MEFDTVLEPKYHTLKGYSDGLARVMKDHKWGYIDLNYTEVIPIQFDSAETFENSKARVLQGKKIITINTAGDCIQNCE